MFNDIRILPAIFFNYLVSFEMFFTLLCPSVLRAITAKFIESVVALKPIIVSL